MSWFDDQQQPDTGIGAGDISGGGYTGMGPGNTGINGKQLAAGNIGITDPGQGSNKMPLATAPSFDPNATKAQNSGVGVQNGDYQSWFMNLIAGKPFNQQTLNALEPTLKANGVQLTPPNANGEQTKIGIPDGNGGTQWVRVGFGEGHPVWIPQSGGSGGGDGSSGSVGGMADGSLLAPWNTPFTPRDPSQIASDPAYQFQLGQGLQGVQRSAAARGTLLTGGTIKALDQYGQGLASTYNDKYYNRDLGEYNIAKQNFYDNQDRPFNKLSSLAALGKPATVPSPTG